MEKCCEYGLENNTKVTHNTKGTQQNRPFVSEPSLCVILDSNGAVVVKYTYDSWGKLLSITDAQGNDISANSEHIGNINPIRYRGYYYDTETGLYYLQSRYYDPETGRFVNADGYVKTPTDSLFSTNMFAYCENNPVNKADYGGNKPGDLFDTMDEAAIDFANYINAQSISENIEYGSFIYKVEITTTTYKKTKKTYKFLWWTITYISIKVIKKTKIKYSYVAPEKGTSGTDSSIPSNNGFLGIGKKNEVADIHTHAAYDSYYKFGNDYFSDVDLTDSISYLVTPRGTVRKYDPKNPSSELDKAVQICDSVPWDPNHPER